MYLNEAKGRPVDNLWDDINRISPTSSERLGYPTQKPIQLLERIIEASSKEGDWVLDPFCGCGTAIAAAEKLHRHWTGIDVTYLAVNIVKGRLKDSFPAIDFLIEGEPRDLAAAKALAQDSDNNSKRRYQFQWWALTKIGARAEGATAAKPQEGKKGADAGVDGWLRFMDKSEGHYESIVVQVKSGHVGVKDIRELRDVVAMQRAAMGIFLTLEEPTNEMVKEVKATDTYVSPLWKYEYPKLQIITVGELLDGKRPDIPPTVSQFLEAPMIERSVRSVQGKL